MPEDSSRKEEKKKKEELIININNKSTINAFSFPANKLDILEKFRQIARREKGHRGFSLKLQEMIIKEVEEHWRGNEQLLMDHYVKPDAPNPNHSLCNYQRGHKRDGKVFCTNPSVVPIHEMIVDRGIEGMWIPGVSCYSCNHNKLRKKPEET
jgi:hypothetical protein